MDPIGTARERYSVKFYLVAMIFIVFDVEIVFLYPWAVSFKTFLANGGALSWHEFARRVAAGAGHDPRRILAEDAPEASNTVLSSRRGAMLPSFDRALDEWLRQTRGETAALAAE